MSKKKIVTITILMLCFLLLSNCTFYDSKEYDVLRFDKYANMLMYINLENHDFETRRLNYELVSMAHYEIQGNTFFVDWTIYNQINANLNLYNLAWLVSIYNLNNIDFTKNNRMIIYTYLEGLNVENMNDIFQLYQTSILVSYFNEFSYADRLSRSIYERALEIFSHDEASIGNDKVFLRILLNISNHIVIETKLLDEIANRNTSFLYDEDIFNFDETSTENNVFGGILVLNNFIFLNKLYNYDITDIVYSNYEYVQFWFNEVFNNATFDGDNITMYAIIFHNFKNLVDTYSLDLSNLRKSLYNVVVDKDIIFFNLQMYYRIVSLYKFLNIDNFMLSCELVHGIKYWIYDAPPPALPHNMYYGMILSEIFGFSYDKEKFKHFIRIFIENGHFPHLSSLYYLLLIDRHFNNYFTDYYYLVDLINIPAMSIEDFLNLSAREQYHLLFIYKYLNLDFFNNDRAIIEGHIVEGLLTTNHEDTLSNIFEFYYINNIIDLYNIDLCVDVKRERILHFYSTYMDYDDLNIYIVFQMISIFERNNIELIDRDKFYSFISKVRGYAGGYFLTYEYENSYLNFTLDGFLRGFLADNFLKYSSR